ncbi:sigma-70 family RNA polymerase sigma factor [Clostridium beijerinckii]|uniref:RNA polymerase primary sigma factor/RNA polymerase sporulation-specific sigma factor n=1 Tax=Clostridium beijerinckii TaxID=1520 RepID=A0AAE5H2G7_CLOBE|nr:sigma-70 family RNA polymerase sigma factor [Clostridium beijerinckii]ALB44602.1 sigma-70 family RNA polymerase sigma factor [Clostridium beijerinckii NRRL B-598]NSB13041.1 RNA polymerase primary sigma factor/RNA polymerase sporulation-specific sigma factor [Clostridium beijerinckii]OOM22143.1 RNA polymerase sigma factor SigA [Clostridium beijerinckii]
MSNEELVLLYQQGDKQALESLIENNKGRVFKIANKFYTGKTNSIDLEDLEQEGFMGLITAAEKYKFDIDNPASFITYATYWIYQKIHRFVSQKNTNDETSLNTPIKEDEEIERHDLIECVEEGFENIEEYEYLRQLRKDLEEVMEERTTLKEKEVLKLHYGWDCKECSFTYIGSILGVSKSRVQQIESRALRSIRKSIWLKNEYEEYFKSIRYNYNNVTEKIDFANKYFKGVI